MLEKRSERKKINFRPPISGKKTGKISEKKKTNGKKTQKER